MDQSITATRRKDTGEPGNGGQFATLTRADSGIRLTPEHDISYDAIAAAGRGVDPYPGLLARGLAPEHARPVSEAARLAAAYAADDGIDRALNLPADSDEAIVDIEEYATGSDGDRWGEAPQTGYDYEAWTDALRQAWEEQTRTRTAAALRHRDTGRDQAA